MAETKYNLALHQTKSEKNIQHQPWYKERLRTKYIKSLKNNDTSQMLIGKNWVFIKDGLDDFRDGLPAPIDDDVILRGTKGPTPNIQGSSETLSPVKQQIMPGRFTKEEVCYSKVSPLQQQRRDHISEIEYGLTQHPLALYPHLEECLPPDLFEDVVDVLDPEMNLAEEDEDDESYQGEESVEPSIHQTPTRSKSADSHTGTTPESEDKIKNPYKWLPRKEEKEKREKKKALEKRSQSPSQDEHIKNVTKDFCDWVAGLGGESNNIEESTITSLFASGYETKPALSVPIHVVELTNVPPELRMSATVPQPVQSRNTLEKTEEKKEWRMSGEYEPSWLKYRYGAWYLPTKMWNKQLADEPLQDPQELKNLEMSEAKKKSNALDAELAPMHGAKSFMEFIKNKKTMRRPEFLDRVAEFQALAEEEERLKQEQEAAKLKKTRTPRVRTQPV